MGSKYVKTIIWRMKIPKTKFRKLQVQAGELYYWFHCGLNTTIDNVSLKLPGPNLSTCRYFTWQKFEYLKPACSLKLAACRLCTHPRSPSRWWRWILPYRCSCRSQAGWCSRRSRSMDWKPRIRHHLEDDMGWRLVAEIMSEIVMAVIVVTSSNLWWRLGVWTASNWKNPLNWVSRNRHIKELNDEI